MPWGCKACGFGGVSDESTTCPSCSSAKDSWTLVAETTRTFQITGSRVLVLRAQTRDALPEGEFDTGALEARATEAFAVVPKASVQRLQEQGSRPLAALVTVVRLLPRKGAKDAQFLFETLYETREIEEVSLEVTLPTGLPAGGHHDVKLLGVYGPGDAPASPWEDVVLVDLSEEQVEQGYAPFVEVSALKKKPKTLSVAELGRIHVRCLGEDDQSPVANAAAELFSQTGEAQGAPKRTDAEGRVAWEGLVPGSYVVCLTTEGPAFTFYSPAPLLPQDSTAPCVILVPEQHHAHVRVFDADDAPLVGAEVTLCLADGGQVGAAQTTDAQGEVRWDGLADDDYVVHVVAGSLDFCSPVALRSAGGAPCSVLAPEQVCAPVRVFDADDAPLVGAEVTLCLADGGQVGAAQTTDGQGEVRWDGLADDEYVVHVVAGSLDFCSPVALRSAGGAPCNVLAPDVEAGQLISLVLADEGGDPLANEPYTLVFEGGEEPGETGEDGSLNEVLPPGLTSADLHVNGEVYELLLDELDAFDEGDEATKVRACQARLVNLGYEPGPVDGVHGPKTSSALREFQEDASQEATGELDAGTREALLQRHGC